MRCFFVQFSCFAASRDGTWSQNLHDNLHGCSGVHMLPVFICCMLCCHFFNCLLFQPKESHGKTQIGAGKGGLIEILFVASVS